MAQLEAISVFQQTQINITFFTNYSTVLLTFATAAFVTVCYWPMTYSVVTYIMTWNDNSCLFSPFICNISFPFCLSTSGTAGNSLCLLLLDFQLTRMRNQEVFSLLYVEYSAALYVFSAISNHLLSQCPQGVKRF